MSTTDDRRAWLERLPLLVEECAARWSLELGEPFSAAQTSLAFPAWQADDADAVLKLSYPHRESEHEAAALIAWDGNGAVRLLAHDRERHALLLERCRPGTPLSEANPDLALPVVADLLRRLGVSAGEPFRPLADEAAWWASYLESEWERFGRPFERRLLEAAARALEELPPTQGDQVLLHQDLHGENVLRAEREPWLAIDPKPLVGERAFSLAPVVRSFEFGHTRRDALRRLDFLADELEVDRERARLWTIGQTIAWCFDSEFLQSHVETARWLLDA